MQGYLKENKVKLDLFNIELPEETFQFKVSNNYLEEMNFS